MVIAKFLEAALSRQFLSKTRMILNGIASRFGDLALVMLSLGIIGTIGIMVMQKACAPVIMALCGQSHNFL
jgi:hypothetical protein